MTGLIKAWSDFTKGEAGTIDKANIEDGFFTGEQVMLYRDGSVGPRSGVVSLASSATGFPAGTLYNMGYANITQTNLEWIWIYKGTKLAMLPVYSGAGAVLTGQVWTPSAASFAALPDSNTTDYVDLEPGRIFITNAEDALYRADFVTTPGLPILTAVAGAPAGRCIEQFGPFMCVASFVANRNRIKYSAAGDPFTWPAGNFFDVGPVAANSGAATISAMRVLRDMLLVFMNTGTLYVITGSLTQSGGPNIRTFQYGDLTTGPGTNDSIARERGGSVWWTRRDELPFQQDQLVDGPSAVPAYFDGTTRDELVQYGGYLRQPSTAVERRSLTTAFIGRGVKSVGLVDQAQRVLLQRAGVWSRHHLAGLQSQHIAQGLRGDVFALNAAGSGAVAWLPEMERPPWSFSGTTTPKLPFDTNDAGAAYSPPAWLATPEFRTQNADRVDVKRVDVFFTAFDTRDATNSHLECFVQQYDRVDAVEVDTSGSSIPPDSETSGTAMIFGMPTIGCTPAQWDVAAPARPTRYRVTFWTGPDNAPSLGFRVLLRGLRGISVHEVHAFGDITRAERA